MQKTKLRFLGDTMGLAPFPVRFKEALTAVLGEEDIPRSHFGLSSLAQLYPRVGPKLWRGKPFLKNKVLISNLFNHTQTPIELGWSVKKTQALDFRGKNLTYDSHNGTDFAIPVGSTVCTSAPGQVVAVVSQFNRGGLKVFIEHGKGLITSYGHLAHSFVKEGDLVNRAQPIAISGYSGIDAAVTFPFGVPHVHLNVWLNGEAVDPFPYGNNASMWRNGAMPAPPVDNVSDYEPSQYLHDRVEEAINCCKTTAVRERLKSIADPQKKAAHTIIEMNYFPTRFTRRLNVYAATHQRLPVLDLPFLKTEFNEVVFLDEVLPKAARKY